MHIINPGEDDNYGKSYGKENDHKRRGPFREAEGLGNVVDQLDDHEGSSGLNGDHTDNVSSLEFLPEPGYSI